MAVDEHLLRRAFCEPLPEPKELPTMAPGYWSDEQRWSPPSPFDRVEGVARAVLDHVKRLTQ